MCDLFFNSSRSLPLNDLDAQLLDRVRAYLQCLRHRKSPSQDDMRAWARFYSVCDPILRRFAKSCSVPPDDVDDCVQLAWVGVSTALPSFRYDGCPARLGSWLHLIVHSKAMNLRRYRDRHPSQPLTRHMTAALKSRYGDSTAADEQQSQRARLLQVLAEIQKHVSPVNYRLIQLRWVKERKISQIAAKLNLTTDQVRFRCARMKKKVRQLYELGLARE